MEQRWNYYQFRKQHQYPVYIRLVNGEIDSKFVHLIGEVGFSLLNEAEIKKISLHDPHSKLLTVQAAGPKVERQIYGPDLLDKYGHENLSFIGSLPIYTYRRVGLLALPRDKNLWELAVSTELQADQLAGMKVMIARFLASALSDLGVLCYWGSVKDGAVILMKQAQSFGEAVLIDLDKKTILSQGGEMRISQSIKIIRRDTEARSSYMSREDLISFLSVHSCLLSFSGVTSAMKKSIFTLSQIAQASYQVNQIGLSL